MVYAILLLIVAYIIGSFPSALVVGKVAKGIDIREHGSGNLGSTNAIRVLGKPLGFIVFFLDVFKGFLCAGVARLLIEFGYELDYNNITALGFGIFPAFYYALMAVIGHMFPVFARFKGGKAVATSLGITLVFTPIASILCVITFGITIKLSGYSSLGSILAILTVLIEASFQKFLIYPNIGDVNGFVSWVLGPIDWALYIFYIAISLFMIYKHRKNIIRLFKGTENSFKKKKESEEQ